MSQCYKVITTDVYAELQDLMRHFQEENGWAPHDDVEGQLLPQEVAGEDASHGQAAEDSDSARAET